MSIDTLEKFYYISQIASALVVLVSLIFAIIQYLQYKRENAIEKSKNRTQKAIELAEFYKDNILNKIGMITSIYEEAGLIFCQK